MVTQPSPHLMRPCTWVKDLKLKLTSIFSRIVAPSLVTITSPSGLKQERKSQFICLSRFESLLTWQASCPYPWVQGKSSWGKRPCGQPWYWSRNIANAVKLMDVSRKKDRSKQAAEFKTSTDGKIWLSICPLQSSKELYTTNLSNRYA